LPEICAQDYVPLLGVGVATRAMTNPSDWFAEGAAPAAEPVQHTSPAVPTSAANASTWLSTRRAGYAAAALTALSLFLPWYTAEVGEVRFDITGRSPWILGFCAVVWMTGTILCAWLAGQRRTWAIGAIGLLTGGLIIIGQVTAFVAFRSIFGWVAGAVNSLADSETVESSVGAGAFLQVAAGLVSIVAGLLTFNPKFRKIGTS
jgi:hypothetical protein